MRFKNTKVILICGYSRGGTNIAWNLLQSHPDIVSTIHETGTIFRKKKPLHLSRTISLLRKTKLLNTVIAKKIIDRKLFQYKLMVLQHSENRFKTPSEVYNKKEISNAALCLKSVDYDIYLTDILMNTYPDLYLILLTRNGYALVEGQIRRGESPTESAELYHKVYERMRYYMENNSRTMMIKFEDILNDPFGMVEKLLAFCDCNPPNLEYLRFKSKKTIGGNGRHSAKYGEAGKKYWFDKNNIREIIVSDINQMQIERLDAETISIINNLAGEAMEYFDYKKIE